MPERPNQRLSFGIFSLTHAKKRYWGPGQNPGNTTIPYWANSQIIGEGVIDTQNTTVQWAANGYDSKKINWHSVGQSAISGAIGGAFNYGIGEALGHATTDLGQFAAKTAAHGVSGGVQNALLGGNVGTGFLSGSAGYAAGGVGASLGGDLGGLAGSSLGGGAASAAAGGDFGAGAQIGAMGYLFNSVGEWTISAGINVAKNFWNAIKPNQVTMLNFTATFQEDGYAVDLNLLPGASIGRQVGSIGGEGRYGISSGIKAIQGNLNLNPNGSVSGASGGWSFGIESRLNFTIKGSKYHY